MNLLTKILLWMFPIALPVMGFTWSYYQAQLDAGAEHTGNVGVLVSASGAQRLNDFLRLRASEFTLISGKFAVCESSPSKEIYQLKARNALQQSRGFSALIVSGIDGKVQLGQVAGTPSNRFMLPRSLENSWLFTAAQLERLNSGFNIWQEKAPQLRKEKSKLFLEALSLERRGEINSSKYNNIQSQIFNITNLLKQPPAVINFNGGREAEVMGLPYRRDTFLFTRPLVSCEGELAGYITAFLDRSQIEDILYELRQSLYDRGIHQVDIALMNRESQKYETETRYLTDVSLHGIEKMPASAGYQRKFGGFLAIQPIADAKVLNQLMEGVDATEQGVSAAEYQEYIDRLSTMSLLVFIADEEWHETSKRLLLKVSVWLLLSLLFLFVLVFFLARNIVRPIVKLKRSVAKVEAGDLLVQADISSDDEVGQLARAFNRMTRALQLSENELQRLARVDELTGLLNRRALIEEAINERHRASRSEYDISLAILDLDYFKQINDRYGHAAGDLVLKQFADMLQEKLRKTDIVGRIGGEEFVILLPDTSPENAVKLIDKLRISCAETMIGLDDGILLSVKFSAGVVVWSADTGFEEALHRADEKLYQAKENGRNCVKS